MGDGRAADGEHIDHSSLHKAMYPKDERDAGHFNPLEVPILDILALYAEKEYGWQYPSKKTLQQFQAYRGLSNKMIADWVTKELVFNGTQLEQEQQEIIRWHHARMEEDSRMFPYCPLSGCGCGAGSLHTKGHAPAGRTGALKEDHCDAERQT